MCILGGGEVWAHAHCLKARIWHCENVTKIPEMHKKGEKHEENGESVMNRHICSGRCGIWRLWKAEPLSQSGRLGGIKTMAQRKRDAGFFFSFFLTVHLYSISAQVLSGFKDVSKFHLQRFASAFLLSTFDISSVLEYAGSPCPSANQLNQHRHVFLSRLSNWSSDI